jgi:Zn-dependent protease with chaperone function
MDFFSHQAHARGRTRKLVIAFIVAVAAVVFAINTLVVFALELADVRDPEATGGLYARHPYALVVTSIMILAVMGIASLYKVGRLRGGGGVVARDLGGTLVTPDNGNPAYRRLRNVVEEIAIASGVPVPEIYVLEQETGINAFAAGYVPADAAVAVTRGAVEELSRDELQGVIAHEFSHILNGDMRLNIRLMGVLFGLLVIGIVAREFLLRTRGGGKEGNAIVFVALGIMVIGFVGLFCGRMIKAGVSRQREYLADASAVQFTRMPDGLAGALKKIGLHAEGAKLATSEAEEVSHMLFCDGVGYAALTATHPPLLERIRRIDPRYDGKELAEAAKQAARRRPGQRGARDAGARAAGAAAGAAPASPMAEAVAGLAVTPAAAATAAKALPGGAASMQVSPKGVAAQVANPAKDDFVAAHRIADAVPEPLRVLAYMQDRAAELVLAMVVDADPGVRAHQLEAIANLGEERRERIEALMPAVQAVNPMHRLPLAAMAFPALRRLPRPWLERFVAALDAVVRADGALQLSEYCLARLVAHQVMESLDPSKARPMGRRRLRDCAAQLADLFSVLARHGQADAEAAQRAYVAGLGAVLDGPAPRFAPPADWAAALDLALPELDRLDPAGKQRVIEGMVRCMSHDERITVSEAELLRTVCAALHCPLPPMLAGA